MSRKELDEKTLYDRCGVLRTIRIGVVAFGIGMMQLYSVLEP
jgi:hypothetical protein